MSISLAQVAHASNSHQFHPSQINMQQTMDAAMTAAAKANEAAKGLKVISASITLAASTFESKMATAMAAFDVQIKVATTNLKTQVQASEMRIETATSAAMEQLTSHANTLNRALREEYQHLFGQLSGHTYTAVDAKVEEVTATMKSLLEAAQAKTNTATAAFDHGSVKAHSSLALALTSVKTSISEKAQAVSA